MQKIYIQFSLFFTLFVLFGNHVLSQGHFSPGYIVLNSGDTLQGFIKDQPDSKMHLFCLYKAERNDEARKYYPDEIKAYRYKNDRAFESHLFENTSDETEIQLFFEVLFQGEKNLYMLRYMKKKYFFLETNGSLFSLSPKESARWDAATKAASHEQRFKGNLHYLLSDAPQIAPLLDKAKPQAISLIGIAKAYHQATSQEADNYEIPHYSKELGVEISPVIAYTSSWISHNYRTQKTPRVIMVQNFQPQLGLRFDIRMPKTRTTLFTSIHYEAFTSKATEHHGTSILDMSEMQLFIDYSLVTANLGLSFPLKELFYPSFLYTGLRFGHLFNYKIMQFSKSPDEITELYFEEYVIDETFGNLSLGIMAGYQFHKQLTERFGLRLGVEAGFSGVTFGEELRYLISTGLNLSLIYN